MTDSELDELVELAGRLRLPLAGGMAIDDGRRFTFVPEHDLLVVLQRVIEALQALYDVQNGPPLARQSDAAAWQRAMDLAEAVLNRD